MFAVGDSNLGLLIHSPLSSPPEGNVESQAFEIRKRAERLGLLRLNVVINFRACK